jgi:hypothetical protein
MLSNVIVFYLKNVKLLKSVPITTNIVSSNPTHSELYSIQEYVIKFGSELRQDGGFLRVSSTNKTNL